MNRSARTVGVFLAALLVLAATGSGKVHAQDFRFTNFEIVGNQRIEPATILTYLDIAPGEVVTGGQVNAAQQRLQGSGLFEEVVLTPRGGTLLVEVREYPTINRIAIEGNRRLDDEDLLGLIRSQPRRVYSPSTAEQDAAAISDAYADSGRLAATVRPVIIRRSENRVDLVFEVTEGRVVETQRIAFSGNRAFSDRRLRRVIESTQAGIFRAIVSRDTFIEDRIAFDIQLLEDFYSDRGHIDFEVTSVTSELARNRAGYFVTFNVREGQSYSFGAISVTSEIPEADADEYLAEVRVSEGTTYSPRLVDNTITRLENLATRQGLRFVRVEPRVTRNDETLTLDIEFVISRGERIFVERIDIEGNATTLDRVVRRQFTVVEGDPFNPRAIRQAADRIRALGFFSEVTVEGRQGTAPDQVIVDVDVEEEPTGSLGFSLSYSTDDGTGVAITFSERNFLGRGQEVRFSLNTTEDSEAFLFSFEEPDFLRRDLEFGFEAFYQETDNASNTSYDTVTAAFTTGLGFPTGEYSRARVFYTFGLDEILNVPAASSAIIQREAGELSYSAIGYEISYDTRDTGLDPNRGVLLRFEQELGGLGGDSTYLRTTALAQGETRVLREEVTLRATLEGGAIAFQDGGSRVTDRFFLSSRQMRGFDPQGLGPRDLNAPNMDALGGNYYAVLRLEAGFPLPVPDEYGLSGGVFFDVGTVWGLDDTLGTGGVVVDDSMQLRSTIGFSLFWDTVLGPLRFNFSTPIESLPYDRTRSFDFTIETRF